ncbi:MAG: ABC transporter substrate-binding protein [Deltaproteobacteria bacterium]|nr:ABC transporter substrate-binding protein [Deltaproteobacteria bacterium]
MGASLRVILVLLGCITLVSACTMNSPYGSKEKGANIFYTTFSEPPKHLDPAMSYSSDEYDIISQIYEPLLQYHYLKRPYELAGLAAEDVPVSVYYDKDSKKTHKDAPAEKVARAVYEIKIKKGIMYQPHPAFAKKKDGQPFYKDLAPKDLGDINEIRDFPLTDTRELTSDDYIYQIKRLADPLNHSPIISILEKYILGLNEFKASLEKELGDIRRQRKEAAGAGYNQTTDEERNPIILDYTRHELKGVEKIGDHAFRITLKTKYPQFAYWLAMPFFSPVPKETAIFYKEPALIEKNITLDRFPVGTGPFMMERYNPNSEITLVRNKNFHGERYPKEGEVEDIENGLLKDADKDMPFLDRIVFKLEKEAIPRWTKFLQGYYDSSGITSDSFDQAVTLSVKGGAELTDFMKEQDIRLLTSVRPATYYMGFNMLDDVVGGYSPEKQKLRQAISIALDYEEYIEIFNNGRGIAAMSPLPPGIFGYSEGEQGINPYIYRWDTERARPRRKTIEDAKELLKEAGYPQGRDKEGRPLIITFDNGWTGVDSKPIINWYIKKFKLLGIQLENRTTDYNRFQEKIMAGNFQFMGWGWNADYPDPENFFFLLAGANSKVKYHGENAVNYSNPEFDRLFKEMENMENGPERLAIINKMNAILEKDAPWVWGYHPVAFGLMHGWVENIKSNAMANNTMKYIRVDTEERGRLRTQWNKPNLYPLIALALALIAGILPAIITIRKRLGLAGKKD